MIRRLRLKHGPGAQAGHAAIMPRRSHRRATRSVRRALAAWLVASAVSIDSSVVAQDVPRPSAAVLETQVASGIEATLGGAADRMIRARLDGLGVVTTASGVALDLADVQLALGCVGETAECLSPVADELSVQLLVIPHLDRSGDALLLTIARFDRRDGSIRRVLREARGGTASTDLIEAIEGQLRELFDRPAAPEPEPTVDPPSIDPPADREAPNRMPPEGPTIGPWSLLLLGIGGASLIAAIPVGVVHVEAQREWNDARPATVSEVELAYDAYDRANAFGIGATVLYITAGVALAIGSGWLIADLFSRHGSSFRARWMPIGAPNFAGLAATGQWEWAQ